MERVGGETLRQWLATHPTPEATAQRRLAEDLLAGLDYLEQQSVTHKDLKPTTCSSATVASPSSTSAWRNSRGRTLRRDRAVSRPGQRPVDARHRSFRCGALPLRALRRTPRLRRPCARARPDPHCSRGRHRPTGIGRVFPQGAGSSSRKAFSVCAVRCGDALLVALGDESAAAPPAQPPQRLEPTASLRSTGLSRRAIKCSRSQPRPHRGPASGARSDAHSIDPRHRHQDRIRHHQLSGGPARPGRCAGSGGSGAGHRDAARGRSGGLARAGRKLPLPQALRTALTEANLPTVGAVASLTRDELLDVTGIGRTRLVAGGRGASSVSCAQP